MKANLKLITSLYFILAIVASRLVKVNPQAVGVGRGRRAIVDDLDHILPRRARAQVYRPIESLVGVVAEEDQLAALPRPDNQLTVKRDEVVQLDANHAAARQRKAEDALCAVGRGQEAIEPVER